MKAKAPRHDVPTRTPATHENGSRTAVGMLGNRPEMVMQRKLHALARNSPQARRAAEWHDRANAGQRSAGRGQALPSVVRGKMERSFGANFSSVRVHEDSYAGSLGAVAATRGRDVHFAPGSYQPHTRRGQEVLGHELTHVVQQSQGRVRANTQAKGWPINDQPALEHEADQMGARAARGEHADIGAPGHGTGETAVVQRLVASIPGGNWGDKDGPKDDKTFINTTLTAHAKVGGKIKRIDHTNFAADFEDTQSENLAITGHGYAGGIGSLTAQDVADYLTDSNTGLTADHRIPDTIHFENCYAAADPDSGDKVITKVQSELAAHLGESNVPTIIGPWTCGIPPAS